MGVPVTLETNLLVAPRDQQILKAEEVPEAVNNTALVKPVIAKGGDMPLYSPRNYDDERGCRDSGMEYAFIHNSAPETLQRGLVARWVGLDASFHEIEGMGRRH